MNDDTEWILKDAESCIVQLEEFIKQTRDYMKEHKQPPRTYNDEIDRLTYCVRRIRELSFMHEIAELEKDLDTKRTEE